MRNTNCTGDLYFALAVVRAGEERVKYERHQLSSTWLYCHSSVVPAAETLQHYSYGGVMD